MTAALDEVLRHPRVWRAGSGQASLPGACTVATRTVPTGNPSLDAWLPNGGWPAAALTELLCEHRGIGEFELLASLLARFTGSGERAALVAPPLLPYAPALAAAGIALEHLLVVRPRLLAEGGWAAEQLLRSGAFGAVLLWVPGEVSTRSLRRLQLAAEQGAACAFTCRHSAGMAGGPACGGAGRAPSPAALRLRLAPCGERVRAAARAGSRPRLLLEVLKCRGRAPATPLAL